MKTRAERRKTEFTNRAKNRALLNVHGDMIRVRDNGRRIVIRPIGTVRQEIKKQTSRAARRVNELASANYYKRLRTDAKDSYLDW